MPSRDIQIDKLVSQREMALKQEEQRLEELARKLINKNKLKRLIIKNEPFWNFKAADEDTKTSFLRKLLIVDKD